MDTLNPTDWGIFRDALIAMWNGANPYLTGVLHLQFYNPVWTLLFLTPYSWFLYPYDIILMWISL